MVKLFCPRCGRGVPADTIETETTFCPFCGWQGRHPPQDEPSPSRDGRRDPVETARPEAIEPPEESVHFSVADALARALWSGFFFTTTLALALMTIFVFFAVCMLMVGLFQPGGLKAGPGVVAIGPLRGFFFFFLFLWCFVGVVAFPMQLISVMRTRKRTIRVIDGRLVVEFGRSRKEIALEDCRWSVSEWAFDDRSCYFSRQRLVSVGGGKQWHVCGFTETKRSAWERYLTAVGVPRMKRVRWRWFLAGLFVGAVAGGALGAAVVRIAVVFGVDPGFVGFVAFLGCLEGAMAVLILFGPQQSAWDKFSRAQLALVVSLVFAGLSLKILLVAAALPFAAGVIGGNAVLGAVLGWLARGPTVRSDSK